MGVTLPKKLLRVDNLTFILPDDFEGDLEDAFRLLVDYIHDSMKNSIVTDKTEDEKLAAVLSAETNKNVSLNYGIFELGDDKTYHLK